MSNAIMTHCTVRQTLHGITNKSVFKNGFRMHFNAIDIKSALKKSQRRKKTTSFRNIVFSDWTQLMHSIAIHSSNEAASVHSNFDSICVFHVVLLSFVHCVIGCQSIDQFYCSNCVQRRLNALLTQFSFCCSQKQQQQNIQINIPFDANESMSTACTQAYTTIRCMQSKDRIEATSSVALPTYVCLPIA